MDIVALVLFFALVTRFVIRGWTARGRLSARDRLALITSFAVAITTFVIARLLINWVTVLTSIWLVAVALLAGGVTGMVLRWPELAWFSGKHPIRRTISLAATLMSCALIIGVAVT